MNKVIVVGGGKGGVGKTTIAMGVADLLISKGENVVLVESDKENSDAYFALEKVTKSIICDLAEVRGWELLGNEIEANPNSCFVVNTASGATKDIKANGHLLTDVADELKRDLIMLWPINRQRDCLELLNKFFETDSAKKYTATYAVKNMYFGDSHKFARFDNSNVKKKVTGTIDMPELYDMLADKIIDNRFAFSNATGLSIVERSILAKFRTDVEKAFNEML